MRTGRIFEGIHPDAVEEMLNCFSATVRKYKTGSTILNYAGVLSHICVVLSGTVEINCLDADGNLNLVETLGVDDVFGELFALPVKSRLYHAVAKSSCEILFIQYDKIVRRCERMCMHHDQLINNLFVLSAQKAQGLARRIAILSQKTLQQKLLLYLEYMALETGSQAFTLQMPLSRLAQYLSVDRSAMMRELNRMRRDGLIRSNGRYFELIASHDAVEKLTLEGRERGNG